MALRFMDSFDHYTTLASKYTSSGGSISVGTGRNGTNSRREQIHGDGAFKVLDAQPTWIVGVAALISSSQNSTVILAILDGSNYHVKVYYSAADGFLHLETAGVLRATGTHAISASQWNYIELKATIADSGGTAELRINGAVDCSYTGDTRAGGNATADRIQQGTTPQAFPPGVSIFFDDYYICDGVDQSIAEPGSLPNNDFLGDVRVQALFPNGNGATSQLLGSDGNSTDNYLLVDETTPNDDTDYVGSTTTGNKDTYTMTDLTPTSGTIYGVQVLPYARKSDAGTRTIVSTLRLSGTETDSASKTLLTGYTYLPDIRGTKPGGGTFSIADINAIEAGIKING